MEMWKRDRRNSDGWQRAFATAAAYASHNPTARQWPVRESDSRLGHCPKTKICLLAAQGGWMARSTGGTLVEPILTAVGVQFRRERASWRSIRPNFCAGSKSNSRLAPISARGANRTVVWLQILCGKQIEQSFGPNFCAGSKSNSRLAPISAREANRTVVWLQILRGEQIEQLFGSADGRRGKSNGLLATKTVRRKHEY